MKKLLTGVLIGLILGWTAMPIVSARVRYKYTSLIGGMNKIITLLEEIKELHIPHP